MAALAAEELADKLGAPDLTLDATALQGADHAALAGATLALTNAGVPLADALAQGAGGSRLRWTSCITAIPAHRNVSRFVVSSVLRSWPTG